MNVRLTCTDCGNVLEVTTVGDDPVDGPLNCDECGAKFLATVTRLC
jgi:transcription elongation factor Elf1